MQLLLVGRLDTEPPNEGCPFVRSSIDVLEVLLADGGNIPKGVNTELAVGIVTRLPGDQLDARELDAMDCEAPDFFISQSQPQRNGVEGAA